MYGIAFDCFFKKYKFLNNSFFEIFFLIGIEYPTKCKLFFLKSIIFLLYLSITYASDTFHSSGIFQSNTFVPDLNLFILSLGNSSFIIFNVFLTPSPVKLLFIVKSFFFCYVVIFFNRHIKYLSFINLIKLKNKNLF